MEPEGILFRAMSHSMDDSGQTEVFEEYALLQGKEKMDLSQHEWEKYKKKEEERRKVTLTVEERKMETAATEQSTVARQTSVDRLATNGGEGDIVMGD